MRIPLDQQPTPSQPRGDDGFDAASLAGAVLAEEAARRAETQHGDDALPLDALPGVGGEQMPLKQAFRIGGFGLVGSLFLLNVVDEFPRVAALVLAPDIQQTFGISDTTLLGLIGLTGVLVVLSTLPAASLGDRIRRLTIVAVGALILTATTVLTGLAANPFQLGLFMALGGIGVGFRMPNASSLLADGYPIEARARVYAFEGAGRPIGQLLGPFVAGAIAAIAGGDEGWRWALIVLCVPFLLLAILNFVQREPKRGAYEQQAVLGTTLEVDDDAPPISLSAAFARLRKVRSFYFLAVGVGVLGFALVSVPGLISLLLEEDYGYGAFTRGWMLAISWSGTLIALPLAGRYGEKLMRRDPSLILRLCGILLLCYGHAVVVALQFDSIALLIAGYTIANACQASAFVLTGPAVATVVPYRMRSQAFAIIGLYVFLMGGFFGNLLAGSMSDAWGERTALTVVVPPAALIGGFFIVYAGRFMRKDISLVVEEIREEQAEQQRLASNPDDIPVLQVHNLDYSYGPVQVLFGVDLEVRKGETLALLGTNGAGKSTILRAVGGLGVIDRGVVRFNGRDITYSPAEYRFGHGIIMVRGGQGIFPGLSVRENLDLSLTTLSLDDAEIEARIGRATALFPVLQERMKQRAGDLSGGQRQMLALAKALVHDPELLIIDELSLGLAPVVVQELIEVVEQLRARGQTMIIVEQSMNIALSLADRAIYLEKGRVQFEGVASELAERDDLVKAVFLGMGAHS
ncbi:MAG: ATP-binding protein [Acidimicrobiales bacterium]|nr:ATP-binding protein [Acidimicrobiales bacterium]